MKLSVYMLEKLSVKLFGEAVHLFVNRTHIHINLDRLKFKRFVDRP